MNKGGVIPRPSLMIKINGQDVMCNADGTALFNNARMLVVSDLHLEKGRALSATSPVPQYDTDATLIALEEAILRDKPDEVLFLGDSFHRADLAKSLAQHHQDKLQELAHGRNFIWVLGNHDPNLPDFLPGEVAMDYVNSNITFRHIAQPAIIGGEVSGHYHPKVRIKTKVRAISGKCFIHDGQRLIMPAFGAYTGGLSVFDQAIADLFPQKSEILFCHACQLFRYPYSQVITPT